MRDLIIVGAGGHGREMVDIVEAINDVAPTWNLLGFLDDGPQAPELSRRRAPLLGAVADLEHLDAAYVIGIGAPRVKAHLDALISPWGHTAATLVHPQATVGGENHFDQGVVLAAGARVTTNVTLGRHVQLNVNAVVSHDCRVGDHSTLSPGTHLNGAVSVAEAVFFGTGSIVVPGVSIGAEAIIGAGTVVLDDITEGATVVGVPGRTTEAERTTPPPSA